MEQELIYERRRTPLGVKLEIIYGGQALSDKVWPYMAKQIYAENGRDDYRSLAHTPAGAPLLEGESTRISLTHTERVLAIATLAPTPEANLEEFSEQTALGIDIERIDRKQAINVRNKFLNDTEQAAIPADDVKLNILAWTCKEAMLKLSMNRAINYRDDIKILELPEPDDKLGQAILLMDDKQINCSLCTLTFADYFITIAITDQSATFA